MQTDRQRQTKINSQKQTDGQIARQIDRHTNRQTEENVTER